MRERWGRTLAWAASLREAVVRPPRPWMSWRVRALAASVAALGAGAALFVAPPVVGIEPGEVGIRVNRLTGGSSWLPEGFALELPLVHRVRRYTLREKVYRPEEGRHATGGAAYQTVEGLSIGVEVTVRYALDPGGVRLAALRLPDDVDGELVRPLVDGIVHRVLARHTVREVLSTARQPIEDEIAAELAPLLAADGVTLRAVFLGAVDLPAEFRRGLDGLLAEGLAADRMRYTLELKEKAVRQSELEAEADRARRRSAAEAAGEEEVIAARARAEAMKHVLPFKEKEILQRGLEAEAQKVMRVKLAEASAEAQRIEAGGEADRRRRLAEADAYRSELLGKVASDILARDSELIAKNPYLIQKAVADKLSDKISVIIAPPEAGFFAQGLLGRVAPAGLPVPSGAPVPSGDFAADAGGPSGEEGP